MLAMLDADYMRCLAADRPKGAAPAAPAPGPAAPPEADGAQTKPAGGAAAGGETAGGAVASGSAAAPQPQPDATASSDHPQASASTAKAPPTQSAAKASTPPAGAFAQQAAAVSTDDVRKAMAGIAPPPEGSWPAWASSAPDGPQQLETLVARMQQRVEDDALHGACAPILAFFAQALQLGVLLQQSQREAPSERAAVREPGRQTLHCVGTHLVVEVVQSANTAGAVLVNTVVHVHVRANT